MTANNLIQSPSQLSARWSGMRPMTPTLGHIKSNFPKGKSQHKFVTLKDPRDLHRRRVVETVAVLLLVRTSLLDT
jgi:hypothetical protein